MNDEIIVEHDDEECPPTPRSEGTPPKMPVILGSSLGLATLERARADLAAGVREDEGTNDGERIREMDRNVGIMPPASWCAAAFTTWMREAADELGMTPPIEGSPSALALAHQFQVAKSWSAADAKAEPGMVAIWKRPPSNWHGHVGVVDELCDDGVHFYSIEGNSGPAGDRVARMLRRLDDPLLLGFGSLGYKKGLS